MPLLTADPRVTRSRRSAVAESSCPAGTTRLTSPQSSAVRASITSPVRAISAARFRPTFLAIATIGVWQNQPPFPPGAAKAASSLATARSALAAARPPAPPAHPGPPPPHRPGPPLHRVPHPGAAPPHHTAPPHGAAAPPR